MKLGKSWRVLLAVCVVLISGCGAVTSDGNEEEEWDVAEIIETWDDYFVNTGIRIDWDDEEIDDSVRRITIDVSDKHQVITGFGSTDAWKAAWVAGQWEEGDPWGTKTTHGWSESAKTALADLLFSQEFDGAGHPIGIGISQWRVNLGGGGLDQIRKSENPGIGYDKGTPDFFRTAFIIWKKAGLSPLAVPI